jgi:DNA-binding NarL/FixJ family response regulator
MIRVLLADDRIVVRSGLRALLATYRNFEVCGEATNGRQAVELAVRHRPDVAILDMTLPEMDASKLRAKSAKRRARPKS